MGMGMGIPRGRQFAIGGRTRERESERMSIQIGDAIFINRTLLTPPLLNVQTEKDTFSAILVGSVRLCDEVVAKSVGRVCFRLGLRLYDMCDDKWMLIRYIIIKSKNVEKLVRPVVISTETCCFLLGARWHSANTLSPATWWFSERLAKLLLRDRWRCWPHEWQLTHIIIATCLEWRWVPNGSGEFEASLNKLLLDASLPGTQRNQFIVFNSAAKILRTCVFPPQQKNSTVVKVKE